MKNTRSRVPSARRCSWLSAALAAAVVVDDGPVAGSMTDMDALPSMRRRPRRLIVLDAGDLGRGARLDGAHPPSSSTVPQKVKRQLFLHADRLQQRVLLAWRAEARAGG